MKEIMVKNPIGYMLLLFVLSSSVYGGTIMFEGYLSPCKEKTSGKSSTVVLPTGPPIITHKELPADIVEGILFMREEEKLAKDVYTYFYSIFPLRPFENISAGFCYHTERKWSKIYPGNY